MVGSAAASIRAAVNEGFDGFFQRIFVFIVFFAVVHGVAVQAAQFSPLLASRKTVIGGTIHGLSTSWLAAAVYFGFLDLSWWPYLGLPISIAYLITDIVFYCMPKGDMMITAHHCVMLICHFTSGTSGGATIAGAGDAVWAQQLSVAGYMSELPNPLLNTRWLMLKKLKEHNPFYFVNSLLLLVLWVSTRLVLMPSLVLFRIFPRYADFRDKGSLDAFAFCIFGHLIVIAMSTDWLRQLLRGGIYAYFVFDPKAETFNPNVKKNKIR